MTTLLEPQALAKLSNLRLNVRQVVEGLLTGLHSSPFKGQSLEFAQHREYSFGDELRHIDWKVFARSDRFFIKQYQDETNLRAYIMLDASGSMGYASKGQPPKLSYAAHLAAALSYLLLRQEDAVSAGAFDTELRFFLPPNHQQSHLSLIFKKLEELKAGGDTGIDSALSGLGRHIKKRGLIILISDLLSEPEETLKMLRYYRLRHHEIMVLQVLDPEEINFGFAGENKFVQLEGRSEVSADADSVRDEYRKLFKEMMEGYKLGFRHSKIDYHLFTTDTPLESALGTFLASRE
jgi:uncharacterized protein (DUF58 family)